MSAMIRKLITAEMKLPNAMGPTLRTLVISSMDSTPSALLMMSWMTGVMISLQSEVTIAPNAPPMITPTAKSMTLPRLMNSLNSAINFFI